MAPVVNVVIAPALVAAGCPALLTCRFPAVAVIAPAARSTRADATISTDRSMRNPPGFEVPPVRTPGGGSAYWRPHATLPRKLGRELTLLALEFGRLLAHERHDADH